MQDVEVTHAGVQGFNRILSSLHGYSFLNVGQFRISIYCIRTADSELYKCADISPGSKCILMFFFYYDIVLTFGFCYTSIIVQVKLSLGFS